MSSRTGLEELIKQIRAASEGGLYYLALYGVLALPDICGALASDNGRAAGPKYKAWLREFVPSEAADADIVWGLRCSLLHQGSALPDGGHFPVAFTFATPAQTPQLHNLSTVVGDDQVGWTSVPTFIENVTNGVEQWLAEYGDSATVTRNLEKFARLRPEGLPGHADWPVIA